MNKKEMDTMLAVRLNEIVGKIKVEYEPRLNEIRNEYKDRAMYLKETIKKTILDAGFTYSDSYLKSLIYINDSVEKDEEYSRLIAERNEKVATAQKENKEIGIRLTVMGVKNPEISGLLLKYLGV